MSPWVRCAIAVVSVIAAVVGLVLILHGLSLFKDVQNLAASWRTPCPAGYGPCHVTPPWAGEYQRSMDEIRLGVLVLSAGVSVLVMSLASIVHQRWHGARVASPTVRYTD
jgi:hypothetical protein